jgi:hypothetical protein
MKSGGDARFVIPSVTIGSQRTKLRAFLLATTCYIPADEVTINNNCVGTLANALTRTYKRLHHMTRVSFALDALAIAPLSQPLELFLSPHLGKHHTALISVYNMFSPCRFSSRL